jgi:pimeloyl-ACP methyl ester carboxylesterase
MPGQSPSSHVEDIAQLDGIGLAPATEAIEPFRVSIPQAALDDLKRRLTQTRFPSAQTVADWSQGVPLLKARALVEYWRDRYDWRPFETRLNSFPQFRTQIDGLGFHFIHVKSKHADALPIMLTHGWPGSIIEFLDVIVPLTDPTAHGGRAEDAFHVVVPSLPGFAFSDKPAEVGWSVQRTARAWVALMQRLGYRKWVAQGGDWGSGVTHTLCLMRPTGLLAAHVNLLFVVPKQIPSDPTPEEKQAFDGVAAYVTEQSGYYKLQSSKPQTVAYALADSPSGQAAWLYEKFQAWTDNEGQPEDALSLDQMLDEITLYWLTDSAGSAAQFYWESARNQPGGAFSFGRIELPMAATVFPRDYYRPPKAWAEALWPNLFYWNEVDRGGHFAAWEQPVLFTDEIRKAFRSIQSNLDLKSSPHMDGTRTINQNNNSRRSHHE